jgi:cytoskeleton-associated protein 5
VLGIRLRPEILPSVVDKCFGSARASIKLKAIELALMWVEVEGTAEGVVVRFNRLSTRWRRVW